MSEQKTMTAEVDLAEVASYDARNHPAQLVRRVHQRGAQLFNQAVVVPNFTTTQFVALVTLLKTGPVAQSHLGRLTSMDPSTTTIVVRKLLKDGLVLKTRSADDQRTSVISLTDRGRDLAVTHIPVSLKAAEQLLDPLSPGERVIFNELLLKILRAD